MNHNNAIYRRKLIIIKLWVAVLFCLIHSFVEWGFVKAPPDGWASSLLGSPLGKSATASYIRRLWSATTFLLITSLYHVNDFNV